MDYNVYVTEFLVRDRLRALRALAADARLAAGAPRQRSMRVVVGRALVAVGQRLLAGPAVGRRPSPARLP